MQRYVEETHPSFHGTKKCTECPTTGITDTNRHDRIHILRDKITVRRAKITKLENEIEKYAEELRLI